MICRVYADADKDRKRMSAYAKSTRPEKSIDLMTANRGVAEMNDLPGIVKLQECFLDQSVENSSFGIDHEGIKRIIYNGDSTSVGKFTTEER